MGGKKYIFPFLSALFLWTIGFDSRLFPGGGRDGRKAGLGIQASAPLGDGLGITSVFAFLQVELLSSSLQPHMRLFRQEDCQAVQSFAPLPLILVVFSLFIKARLT